MNFQVDWSGGPLNRLWGVIRNGSIRICPLRWGTIRKADFTYCVWNLGHASGAVCIRFLGKDPAVQTSLWSSRLSKLVCLCQNLHCTNDVYECCSCVLLSVACHQALTVCDKAKQGCSSLDNSFLILLPTRSFILCAGSLTVASCRAFISAVLSKKQIFDCVFRAIGSWKRLTFSRVRSV